MLQKWVLPMIMVLLALLSLMTLRSVAPTLLGRQVLFFVIGAVIFFLTAKNPFITWQRYGPLLYVVLILGLIATQVVGTVTRGTTSWIPIGPFHIQPSQLAVVWSGLFLSGWVKQNSLKNLSNFIKFSGLVAMPAILIVLEPDLGTTIIYLLSLSTIFFLSPIKPMYIGGSLVGALVVVLLAWSFFLKPYQKERITSFLNLDKESIQSNAGYNAQQSVIAVGSGQVYGRGIGQGIQSHLRFLPERQTDFVFASFSEEMGFIGAFPVIGLYAFLSLFLVAVGLNSSDLAAQYFCFVTAAMITTQSAINIGMNMGIFPITGITLPLFSYGGSSILALCYHLGCIQSLVQSQQRPATLHFR